MPHTEGKVVDRDGKTVARGRTGELLVRGTNIFIGYWDDKEKTRNVIFTAGLHLSNGCTNVVDFVMLVTVKILVGESLSW